MIILILYYIGTVEILKSMRLNILMSRRINWILNLHLIQKPNKTLQNFFPLQKLPKNVNHNSY